MNRRMQNNIAPFTRLQASLSRDYSPIPLTIELILEVGTNGVLPVKVTYNIHCLFGFIRQMKQIDITG